MSQYSATLYVLNNSGESLQGSIVHTSGNGDNKLSDTISVNNLANGQMSSPLTLQVRSNHDDYYLGDSLVVDGKSRNLKIQRNVHKEGSDVFLIINQKGGVVVTQDNGWKTDTF